MVISRLGGVDSSIKGILLGRTRVRVTAVVRNLPLPLV